MIKSLLSIEDLSKTTVSVFDISDVLSSYRVSDKDLLDKSIVEGSSPCETPQLTGTEAFLVLRRRD
jgi:hypothetical protein